MMRLNRLSLEKPLLDRCQRKFAGYDPLFRSQNLTNPDHRSQFCDGLPAKDLLRSNFKSYPIGAGNDLNAENRISPKVEEIVMDTESLQSQNALPNLYQQSFRRCAGRIKSASQPLSQFSKGR